ncbi:MAG: hypothetical protein LBM73_03400 [Candidatus Nomurabacteria bacterium]|jgi:hypothetical protein|nr:hypothetical protein [Candidatus Nomurabacteria bacterium]
MKTKRLWLSGAAAAFIVGAGILGLSAPGSAAAPAKIGLAFSPTGSQRIQLNPGDSFDGKFAVTSTGSETTEVFAQMAPYSVSNDAKTSNNDFTTETDRTQISKWTTITLDNCTVDKTDAGKIYFTMQPKQSCQISYHIAVPTNAVGGSQDAGIFVQSVSKGGAGITSSYRVGYLIYSNISGPGATTAGEVTQNKIPGFLSEPPIYADSTVKNTGSLDFNAQYSIKIVNFFGGDTAYTNSSSHVILAGSSQNERLAWSGAPALGLFKVTQTISTMGKTNTVTKLVLIVPVWLIVLIILIIMAIIALIVWRIGRRGHYKAKENRSTRTARRR